MAVLDKGMKQRMVGALVLVALAVIFLPMLFTREDEMRQVRRGAPGASHAEPASGAGRAGAGAGAAAIAGAG
jgi:cell division septation protein DedD